MTSWMWVNGNLFYGHTCLSSTHLHTLLMMACRFYVHFSTLVQSNLVSCNRKSTHPFAIVGPFLITKKQTALKYYNIHWLRIRIRNVLKKLQHTSSDLEDKVMLFFLEFGILGSFSWLLSFKSALKKWCFSVAGMTPWELGIQGSLLGAVVDLIWDLGQVT